MHLEVLGEKRKKVFSFLPKFKDFYLAGGTALALQIKHRTSVDFDLFIQKDIPRSLLGKVKKVFSGFRVRPLVNNRGELTIFADDIKITFFNSFFPSILKLIKYRDVRLLSVKEIGADKAHTIGRRGKYRDYIDLYFIFSENHSSLPEIINLAEKKYGDEFNSRLFLEQLIYLEDIRDDIILFLKPEVSRRDIQKFFEGEIKKMKV